MLDGIAKPSTRARPSVANWPLPDTTKAGSAPVVAPCQRLRNPRMLPSIAIRVVETGTAITVVLYASESTGPELVLMRTAVGSTGVALGSITVGAGVSSVAGSVSAAVVMTAAGSPTAVRKIGRAHV